MDEENQFREFLQELYHLFCERKGLNPKRGMYEFELTGHVAWMSVRRVISGKRHTLSPETIDKLVDGLYQAGVLSADEHEYWHSKLQLTRARQVLIGAFHEVSTVVEDLADHILESEEEARYFDSKLNGQLLAGPSNSDLITTLVLREAFRVSRGRS